MTTMLADGPPRERLGDQFSIRFEIQFRDKRGRSSEDVSDIVGRWVLRHVRRRFPTYVVDGYSPNVYPGQTYQGWWFGSVEVYAAARP